MFFNFRLPSPRALHLSSGGLQGDLLRLEQDVFVPLAGNKQLYVYEYKGFWRQIKNAGIKGREREREREREDGSQTRHFIQPRKCES